MHTENLSQWKHEHIFDAGNPAGERNAWIVVLITTTMMVVEITAGLVYNSMALLADGWHMSTHAAALGLTGLAYRIARKYAADERFSFGTWKIEVLGGFTSAIILGLVAFYVAAESVTRFFRPVAIQYDQALMVAVIGLMVNLVCAFLLNEHGHHHDHPHHEKQDGHHAHPHKDLNLHAAYLHVLADAATSVFAICALLGGKLFNWAWLDPGMGFVGAIIISIWAFKLMRDTGRVLLDWRIDSPLVHEIKETLEADGDTRISDMHLWRIGRYKYSCILQLVASRPKSLDEYKKALGKYDEIGHLIIEINQCLFPK